jgi:cell pole-organizing protein PopZ
MPSNDTDDAEGETDASEQTADEPDAEEAADVDWEMAPDSDTTFPADAEKREVLRAVAEEVRARGDSSEASQVSAFLYRVSDLYEASEETSPAEIYLNMRHIMDIKAQGGLNRGRDDE